MHTHTHKTNKVVDSCLSTKVSQRKLILTMLLYIYIYTCVVKTDAHAYIFSLLVSSNNFIENVCHRRKTCLSPHLSSMFDMIRDVPSSSIISSWSCVYVRETHVIFMTEVITDVYNFVSNYRNKSSKTYQCV